MPNFAVFSRPAGRNCRCRCTNQARAARAKPVRPWSVRSRLQSAERSCVVPARAHPRLRAAGLERPGRAPPARPQGRRAARRGRQPDLGDHPVPDPEPLVARRALRRRRAAAPRRRARPSEARAPLRRRRGRTCWSRRCREAWSWLRSRSTSTTTCAIVRPHRLRREDLDADPRRRASARSAGATTCATCSTSPATSLPVQVVPHRFRRDALHFGSGEPTEVICSSLIGALFRRVRLPDPPADRAPRHGFDGAARRPAGRLLRRIFGPSPRLQRALPHAPPDAADARRTSTSRRTSRS